MSELLQALSSHAYRVLRERGEGRPPFSPTNNSKTGLWFENDEVRLTLHYMGGHTVGPTRWRDTPWTFPIEELLNVWVYGPENPYDHDCFSCYGGRDGRDRRFGQYEEYQVEAQKFALSALRKLNVLDYFVEQVFAND